MNIRTITNTGKRGVLRGSEAFKFIVSYFRGRFTGIEGMWCRPNRPWQTSTNYEAFVSAYVDDGASMSAAARNTWTGRMAAEAGFGKVQKVDITYDADDTILGVTVRFVRP